MKFEEQTRKKCRRIHAEPYLSPTKAKQACKIQWATKPFVPAMTFLAHRTTNHLPVSPSHCIETAPALACTCSKTLL